MLNAGFFSNATVVKTGLNYFKGSIFGHVGPWIDRTPKGKAVLTAPLDCLSDYKRGMMKNLNVRIQSIVSLPFARMTLAQMAKIAVNTRRGWQVGYLQGSPENPVLVNDKGAWLINPQGEPVKMDPEEISRIRNRVTN